MGIAGFLLDMFGGVIGITEYVDYRLSCPVYFLFMLSLVVVRHLFRAQPSSSDPVLLQVPRLAFKSRAKLGEKVFQRQSWVGPDEFESLQAWLASGAPPG